MVEDAVEEGGMSEVTFNLMANVVIAVSIAFNVYLQNYAISAGLFAFAVLSELTTIQQVHRGSK
jgi:hypothetical protein